MSHKRWKEIGHDESGGEYGIGESAEKGDEESNGIGRNEYDRTRNVTTGNYDTGSDNGASNVSVSLIIEGHIRASYDVNGKDVENNLGENELIESLVSGNDIVGRNMSEDSGDIRTSRST